MNPILNIIFLLLNVYELILLARVLLSWLRIDPYNPVARVLYALTEPILAPIRQILPSTGMLDLSPIVAFLLVFALRTVLRILLV